MRSPKRSPTKSKMPAPQDARWVKRRAAASMRIEKAALQLFVKHGFEAVASEDIAAAAGISRRSFYRYFDSPEDILTAMPRRSLARISSDFRARPTSESPFDAYIGALRQSTHTDEELTLHRLAFAVMHRSPEAWEQAMAKIQPHTTEVYQSMIADRLRASGHDPKPAGVVAAALSAIMLQVCREGDARRPIIDRVGPSVDLIAAGVSGFVDVVNIGKPTRRTRAGATKARK